MALKRTDKQVADFGRVIIDEIIKRRKEKPILYNGLDDK